MRIDSSLGERHAYLDSIVSETISNLAEDQSVQQRLGELTCRQLVQDAQDLFVPNLRDGVLSIPHKYRFQGTPIIAMRRDETVRLGEGFGRMTAAQEEATRKELETWPAQAVGSVSLLSTIIVNALRRAEGRRVIGRSSSTTFASTFSVGAGVGPEELPAATHYAFARPALVIFANQQNEFVPQASSTTKLVHELVHANQLAERPIRDASPDKLRADKVESELHAYHLEGAYTAGLLTSDNPLYKDNLDIIVPAVFELSKIYRQYQLSDDPAKFNTMMATLENEGLLNMLLSESPATP